MCNPANEFETRLCLSETHDLCGLKQYALSSGLFTLIVVITSIVLNLSVSIQFLFFCSSFPPRYLIELEHVFFKTI